MLLLRGHCFCIYQKLLRPLLRPKKFKTSFFLKFMKFLLKTPNFCFETPFSGMRIILWKICSHFEKICSLFCLSARKGSPPQPMVTKMLPNCLIMVQFCLAGRKNCKCAETRIILIPAFKTLLLVDFKLNPLRLYRSS